MNTIVPKLNLGEIPVIAIITLNTFFYSWSVSEGLFFPLLIVFISLVPQTISILFEITEVPVTNNKGIAILNIGLGLNSPFILILKTPFHITKIIRLSNNLLIKYRINTLTGFSSTLNKKYIKSPNSTKNTVKLLLTKLDCHTLP